MKKVNKRTLKKRIRKIITRACIITTIVYSIAIIGLLGVAFKGNSNAEAEIKLEKIVNYMTDKQFYKNNKISNLKDFNSKSSGYQSWKLFVMAASDERMPKSYFNSNSINEINSKKKSNKKLNVNPSNRLDTGNDNSTTSNNSNYSIDINSWDLNDFFRFQNGTEISVKINGKVIYKTPQNNSNTGKDKILNKFSSSVSKNISDGNTVCTIKVTTLNNLYLGALILLVVIIAIAFIVSMFFVNILSRITTIPIITPINQLQKKIVDLANEDYEATINNQLILKRPLREIETIANATNSIMQKIKMNNSKLESQKKMLEAQNDELEAQNIELTESRKHIQEAQTRVEQSEKAVKNLLNHAGQGFLSFGENLVINEHYSNQCINMFGMNIEGLFFPSIIFSGDTDQQKFCSNVLDKVFNDDSKRNIYASLLPDEINLNNRDIHMEYKLISSPDNNNSKSIMVILTDITEKKLLESKMEQEKTILKMVVRIVVNSNEFKENLSDYLIFAKSKVFEIIDSGKKPDDIIFSIFREIHTFKGSFSQLYMANTAHKLNEVESALSLLRESKTEVNIDELRVLIMNCELENLAEEDIGILKDTLGDDFFEKDKVISVEKEKLIDIERKMLTVLSPIECRTLIPDIRRLRYEPFKEPLKKYDEYLDKIANTLEKKIAPLNIEGGDFLVDNDKYKDFIKSLVHIFRNIMDHAIESPEERVEKGKDECGNISCRAELINDNIYFSIRDDGRGIDIEHLRQKAIEKHIYSEEDALKLSDDEVINLIFKDGFSTRDTAGQFSGRGVGLPAVKEALSHINGKIVVTSKKDEGTEMKFIIPNEALNKVPEILVQDIMNPLVESAKKFIASDMGIFEKEDKDTNILRTSKIALNKFTVFVNLKGVIEGKVVLSVDENLAKAITHKFILDEITPDEENELIEDTLSECCNIIIGNSFDNFKQVDDLIIMDIPVTINSDDSSFTCKTPNLWTVNVPFDSGEVSISFMTLSLDD